MAAAALALCACGPKVPPYVLTRDDCRDVASLVDQGRSTVVAYDAATRHELWRTDAGYADTPPLAHAGLVFVVRTTPVGDHSELRALDPATGEERWARPLERQVRGSAIIPYGPDGVAVPFTSGVWGPYAVFDREGRRSDQPWTIISGVRVPLPEDPSRQGLLIISRNEVGLVDPASGATIWRAKVPALAGPGTDLDDSAVQLVDDVVVITTRGAPTGISGIDERTGTVLWTYSGGGLLELAGVERSPTAVVVQEGPAAHGLDPRSGQVLWTTTDRQEVDRHLSATDAPPSRPRPDRWEPPSGPDRTDRAVDVDDGRAFVLRHPAAVEGGLGARALDPLCSSGVASTGTTQGPVR